MNSFEPFFFGIRWQDIVDILLNSYILFRLYVIFRGTNTFRALVGIAFLWFFQRTAFALGLVITSWAIQGITAVGALIVIVVFRNEIRSVFQATNLKTIFWGSPIKSSDTPIKIIVDSIFELAHKRIGALIVLPGKDNLEDILQKGIDWRGLVSKEMLISIFWHDNPVHDGAIIIEGDRVSSVGVILPLSRREDLPLHFGTRHRAAAGMAEQSDALVLLVSEERGEVIATKGTRLEAIHQKNDLERLLYNHLGVPVKQEEERKAEKRRIIFAAVLCLLFITSIWFSIARGVNTVVALEVPIEYFNSDPETEIVETSVNTVRLHLSGSSFLVKSIRPGQVRVRTSINGAMVGRNLIPITLEDVSLPPGIMLKKIEPQVVEVILDKPTVKRIPVQVNWAGKLADDLILTDVKMIPRSVLLAGNSHTLDKISTIYTEKVFLNQIRKNGNMLVSLVLAHPSLRLVSGEKKIMIAYVLKKKAD